jgi:SdrD B-like domain
MNVSPRADRFRPAVEWLERRDVPALFNLTTVGASETVNDAILQQTDAQPTGTGVISSFVRMQGTGVESGYNTDARPLQFNENSSPRFTRSLRLSDVPVVVVGGVGYRQFLLDINQKSSSPLLSLDELKIFLGSSPNLTGYDRTAGQLAGLAAVYDLDAGSDNSVLMNYALNHGSGSGDVTVLIPDRLFASATVDPFVYLYSAFGQTAAANAGFEEWAVLPTSGVTGLGGMSGRVTFDANANNTFDAGDAGLAGVYITLTGIDDRGNEVYLTVVTDQFGNYQFDQLRPGVYTLTETQPMGYEEGGQSVGSLGGYAGLDLFSNIHLGASQFGTGYDFWEWRVIDQS